MTLPTWTFRYELKPELPLLGWAARVRAHDPFVRVLHGPLVEVGGDAFVEGAWGGPFAERRFDEARVLVGSGARITTEGLLFAGHSDLHERLYLIRGDGEFHVAPTLALALAASGTSLDPREPHYYMAFVDAYRAGIRYPRKQIRLLDDRIAEMHDVCNLRVAPDLSVQRVEKVWPPEPRNYQEYVSLLQETLERVISSSNDPARRQRFRPVCTISKGYDSVAVAALA